MQRPNSLFLVFLTSFEYPTRFAHPTHALFMARAFAKILSDCFLFVFSNAENGFNIGNGRLASPFPRASKWVKRLHLRSISYSLWFLFFSWFDSGISKHRIWVFLNDPKMAAFFLLLKPFGRFSVVFESHGTYPFLIRNIIYRLADKHIFVTQALKEQVSLDYPKAYSRSISLSNAVDFEAYEKITESTQVLRQKLSLPLDKIIIGYTGRIKPLGLEKGVRRLIGSIAHLPENVVLCCVGGTADEIRESKAVASNYSVEGRVIFIGHVSPEEVPAYTKSFDVLAYVPEGGHRFFEIETSPMKLFEYMASGRPIFVSDLPTVREVLNENSAFFVSPDIDDKDLASCISEMLLNQKKMAEKVLVAKSLAQKYTWLNRANNIIQFLD